MEETEFESIPEVQEHPFPPPDMKRAKGIIQFVLDKIRTENQKRVWAVLAIIGFPGIGVIWAAAAFATDMTVRVHNLEAGQLNMQQTMDKKSEARDRQLSDIRKILIRLAQKGNVSVEDLSGR